MISKGKRGRKLNTLTSTDNASGKGNINLKSELKPLNIEPRDNWASKSWDHNSVSLDKNIKKLPDYSQKSLKSFKAFQQAPTVKKWSKFQEQSDAKFDKIFKRLDMFDSQQSEIKGSPLHSSLDSLNLKIGNLTKIVNLMQEMLETNFGKSSLEISKIQRLDTSDSRIDDFERDLGELQQKVDKKLTKFEDTLCSFANIDIAESQAIIFKDVKKFKKKIEKKVIKITFLM